MSTLSNDVQPIPAGPQETAVPAQPETRPFYWSVRREVWENRSIYLAPLIVAAVVLFGSFVGASSTLPKRMKNLPADPVQRHAVIVQPFSMAPAPIMLATFIVGLFYALDALYGERRDRSILFWKSLPVSDRTTVLSKASIPLIVLPLIAFVLGLTVQLILLVLTTPVLAAKGVNPARVWAEFRYPQEALVMVYGLTVHSLWFAPIYAWLLLVSAWARRSPALWAILPPVMLLAFEQMIPGANPFGQLLKYRVMGAMGLAFQIDAMHVPIDRLWHLSPGRFLSSGGLWSGLLFAAVCLAVAVRLRRNREPS
ncbi:MAG TPA: ABC transporter permease [Thermoanaerobaculia bacterium]|nr:ABC transporter permease [Thermoanaerobaculia bacterium]